MICVEMPSTFYTCIHSCRRKLLHILRIPWRWLLVLSYSMLSYLQPCVILRSISCDTTLQGHSPLKYFHDAYCFILCASSYFVISHSPSQNGEDKQRKGKTPRTREKHKMLKRSQQYGTLFSFIKPETVQVLPGTSF